MKMTTVALSNPVIKIESSVASDRAMDDDITLFHNQSATNQSMFRLYQWRYPTISLGKLQSDNLLDLSLIDRDSIAVVKRPTGGRHIFHSEDISFSFVIPRLLFNTWGNTVSEQQYTIGVFFLQALALLGISAELSENNTSRKSLQNHSKSNCFSTSIPSEICVNGKKLVGIAHLITGQGALIQGTIPLTDAYLDIVRYEKGNNTEKQKRMDLLKEKSCSLQSLSSKALPPFEAIAELWGKEFMHFVNQIS